MGAKDRAWLARFAKSLIVSNGHAWTSDDDVAVKRALDALAHLPDAQLHIAGFADTLNRLTREAGALDLTIRVKEPSLEQLFLALVKGERS